MWTNPHMDLWFLHYYIIKVLIKLLRFSSKFFSPDYVFAGEIIFHYTHIFFFFFLVLCYNIFSHYYNLKFIRLWTNPHMYIWFLHYYIIKVLIKLLRFYSNVCSPATCATIHPLASICYWQLITRAFHFTSRHQAQTNLYLILSHLLFYLEKLSFNLLIGFWSLIEVK